jgi:hypothetical protein
MNTDTSHHQFLELRLCGEGPERPRHEWIYMHPCDSGMVVELLSLLMKKSREDVYALVEAYDRFTLEAVIQPDSAESNKTIAAISEHATAGIEFAHAN